MGARSEFRGCSESCAVAESCGGGAVGSFARFSSAESVCGGAGSTRRAEGAAAMRVTLAEGTGPLWAVGGVFDEGAAVDCAQLRASIGAAA